MKQVYYKIQELDMIMLKHIIRGDRSDGIPNIHSDDDCFVRKIRQKPITSKIESAIIASPEKYCEDNGIIKNYDRNKKLIDFSMIPKQLYDRIIEAYKNIN